MNKLVSRIPILFFVLSYSAIGLGQDAPKTLTEHSAVFFAFGGGYQLPGADLKKTYGGNANVGASVEYKLPGNKWSIDLSGYYIFGSRVKVDVLDNLRSQQGYLIGSNKVPADVFLRQRGAHFGTMLYRSVKLNSSEDFFGLKAGLGLGWMYHKIRIQDDASNADQINGDYLKGYDRLASGVTTSQFIGIQYLSANGRVNFYVGFDFTQGFTKNRRAWNFDERRAPDSSTRLDLLNGLRIRWILPFYLNQSTEEIYY